MFMNIEDIKISYNFKNSIPSERKMNKCREFYSLHLKIDRDIVVNKDNVLIDGYIGYLVLLENNYKGNIKVKISNYKSKTVNVKKFKMPYYKNHKTMYVFGVHINSKYKRWNQEYCWRIDNRNNSLKNIKIGDIALVATKYGRKYIKVTRIEVLKNSPVNSVVKKVLKVL